MEQSIHKSIRVAQEVAEEVRLNAKKEAELIVQEAEKNADRIINEALQKARSIHSELLELKQKATIYRARFRTLVQSHLDILENSDWESLEELEEGLEEAGKAVGGVRRTAGNGRTRRCKWTDSIPRSTNRRSLKMRPPTRWKRRTNPGGNCAVPPVS